MVKHTPFFALRVMRVLANRLRRQNKPGLRRALAKQGAQREARGRTRP